MRAFVGAVLAIFLTGCVTLSGTYILSAHDESGKDLTKNMQLMAQGRGIYTVINALCVSYPKSIIVIRDATTGEELKGESPWQCR